MTLKNVPVIDITRLHRADTRRELDAACREWGFFQVVGHGVSSHVIDNLAAEMRRFFSQPNSKKRKIERTLENPWGFYDRELTKNTLDWKEIFDYGPAHNPEAEGSMPAAPRWPANLPGFKAAMLDYYAACEALAFRLLSAISINLGMPGNYLATEFVGGHSSFLRLNHYPVCERPAHPEDASEPVDGYLGLNRHTDAGALTVLLQDRQPGLEVFKDDRWHLVMPVDGAFTINVGDIIQVWSNDRYRAALHRVIANPAAERFSAPFFFNPAYSTNYKPLPSTVDAHSPERYRSINWGRFRSLRAAGDYADQGEEIQISHYRTSTEETDHGLYRHHRR